MKNICVLLFVVFMFSCSKNNESIEEIIELKGELINSVIELSWKDNKRTNNTDYLIFEKIGESFEKIGETREDKYIVNSFYIGSTSFYVKKKGNENINISNIFSIRIENIESNRTYLSDIETLYRIKKNNIDSHMSSWIFDFDDYGRVIDIRNKSSKIGYSDFRGKKRITWLNVSSTNNNNKVTSLDGLEDLTALTDLICVNNALKEINLSSNVHLNNLLCFDNQLSILDVKSNTLLEKIYCSNNQISNIDLSLNENLRALYCSANQLSYLDCSFNRNLKELDCSNNPLISGTVNILNKFIDSAQSLAEHNPNYLYPDKGSSIYKVINE